MVNETSKVSGIGGVDDPVVVNAEHVTVDTRSLILGLPPLADDVANQFTGVLADQLVRPEGTQSE